MTWTTPADLRAQVQKLWDKGELLRPCVQGDALPPRRLRLSGPSSTELSERFDEVRTWMKALGCHGPVDKAPRWRIVYREFRHRVLGACAVPDEIWLDTLDDALALLGKHKDHQRFISLVQHTRAQQPALLAWLEKRPLQALDLAQEWPRLLAVVAWLQVHPRPGLYLRQVDVAGVDSKFIEAHRGVLGELLDLALPPEAIDPSATGVGCFCQRYGFKDKPQRIRFRLLDATLSPNAHSLPVGGVDNDITLTQEDFAHLALPVRRVFITENEVNFLAFPAQRASLVIFGAGYGFDALVAARWLRDCQIVYWGDIDTHGFAILNQLRAHIPQVLSMLMDRATLLAHAPQWVAEAQPVQHALTRLSAEETALFEDLRHLRVSSGGCARAVPVRLEQERIGFGWVCAALQRITPP